MCGRFAFYSPLDATAELFGVENNLDVRARYKIAPTQDVVAVKVNTVDEIELVTFRWGLVPSWAKGSEVGSRLINARSETVAEKPSFRDAYQQRRCVIFADGYYEWKTEGGLKTPFFISAADGRPFGFAGLWESWRSPDSDRNLQTATILTAPANTFLSRLHHRMPVSVEPENAQRWLLGGVSVLGEIIAAPLRFCAWPVDHRIGNPRNDRPDLIEQKGALI